MKVESTDWEPTATYSEFVRGVWAVYRQAMEQDPKSRPSAESYWTFIKDNCAGPPGVALVFAIALGLTVLRVFLTRHVLQPIAKYNQLSPSSQTKLCESLWRFIIYTFTFSWAFYSAVLKRPLFQRPSIMFTNFESGTSAPLDIDLLYAFEMGFYLHALYTLYFMDLWKSDSSLLAFHHLIALTLLGLSYLMNCTTSGLLILLLHDCCDVPLELSKVVKYLAVQKGSSFPFMDWAATTFFVLFTATWFIFRLYFYPLRMIHTASHTIVSTRLGQVHFLYPSYLMTLFLLVINVYWTMLIIRLIWNVVTGRMAQLDDLRDSDVVTDLKKTGKKKIT